MTAVTRAPGWLWALCALALLLVPTVPLEALGQDKADKMLRVLKKRPRRMTRETWLEQRREAARELGRLKDKRAVLVLLKIIKKERFDVILEISIDALGEIGDKRAVDPLKKLLNDPSLDSYVRDAVAGSLKKLGVGSGKPGLGDPTRPGPGHKPGGKRPTSKPVSANPEPLPPDEDKTDLALRLAREGSPFGDLPPMDLKLEADLLARTDFWRLVAGNASVLHDGNADDLTSAGLAAFTHYFRQLEKKTYGYTIDGRIDVGFNLTDTGSRDASWTLGQAAQVNPELRFYPFRRDLPLLFGQVSGGVGYSLALSKTSTALENRLAFAGNASVAMGPGYGRMLNSGPKLRLKRLQYHMKQAGLLSDDIDKAVGDQILQAWYKLRNEIGTFKHLGYTLDILRKAGLLAADSINPAVAYKLIRILDDPNLDMRQSGMMFRLGYGYARSMILDADDYDMAFLYATGEYRYQKVKRSFEARMRFLWEMYNDPDSYNLELEAVYSHHFYNTHLDSLGALSALVNGGFSKQPGRAVEEGSLGFQILAGGAYTRYFNRGTLVRAALKGGIRSGAPLIMFTLEAEYGLSTGSFTGFE
jgi:HEAT repeats